MESETVSIQVSPLLFYQKPEIGSLRGGTGESPVPIQLVFPSGGFGVGFNTKVVENVGQHQILPNGGEAVVVSGPEDSEADRAERKGLVVAFVVLGILNFIITIAMFVNATTADPSQVVPYKEDSVASVFEQVAATRPLRQTVCFAFVVITILGGIAAALCRSPLGLTSYCLSVGLNFVLGTGDLPFFLYSLRIALDLFAVYLALVLRSRLQYNFLPMHIHRQ